MESYYLHTKLLFRNKSMRFTKSSPQNVAIVCAQHSIVKSKQTNKKNLKL
jgi:hypothetical protein